MVEPAAVGGSFRDPTRHVCDIGERIFRSITERAARDSGLIADLVERGWLIGVDEVDRALPGSSDASRCWP